MKIYIYNLEKLTLITKFFHSPPPEMDLYEFFLSKLLTNYEIVENIQDCDLAFIPIDFTKLIFSRVKENQWGHLVEILKQNLKYKELIPTSQPPTFGIKYKEDYIKFIWSNYVEDYLNLSSKKPHFLLHSYVLFEVSFEYIPKNIFILSYEKEISLYNTITTYKLGTYNRIITIPYILNSNPNSLHPLYKIDKIYNLKKEFNIAFIGTLSNTDRPLLYKVRNFINYLQNQVKIFDTLNIQEVISKTKYLLVLRGDTPTRISFYQCFAYNTVPIIFESEIKIYNELSTKEFSIYNSCIVLPDKKDLSDQEYSIIVDKILLKELSDENNYLDKIKTHKKIFDNINYFSDESLPIRNALEKILTIS